MHEQGNDRQRRYRFYSVTTREVMALLGNWWHHDFIRLPKLKGLPDGYSVEGLHGSYERDAFVLKVYHPSFDPVGEGLAIPDYTPAEFETVDLRIACPEPRGKEEAPPSPPIDVIDKGLGCRR